ncbi:helix-turn-helix domain-containing protein [Shinella sp. G-2]|uniref:helix-turn-helix domain-containing protein n=1 Tax=Shinella sp. G-2 TaxID=3133141 RepID=UPI003D02CE00
MIDRSTDRMWMTPLLNQIADVAGERAALLLGSEKAGLQIYIPDRVPHDHWLAVLVGAEAADAIAAKWGTQHITIPVAMNGDRRRRAAVIAELIKKGYSNNEIVRMTGVSRRTVTDHRSKQVDDSQGSLF